MKKIFVLFLSIFAMACFSMPAFATDEWTTFSDDTGVKLSANVTAKYVEANSGTSYAAATTNSKGTKKYGVASDSSWIYSDIGTTLAGIKSADSSAFSSWVSGTAGE